MGKAVRGIPIVGNLLAGPEQVKAEQINRSPFDVTQEAKPAQTALTDALAQQQSITGVAAPLQKEVLQRMGEAAAGRGPSLAEAQMKAAQDRTLAQQLGALQSQRGGNAASNARLLMQAQGAAGRNIAQEAAQARLQERNQFMSQGLAAQGMLGTTAGQQLNAAILPKQQQQSLALQQANMNQQANQANVQANNAMTGALLSGAGTVLGGMATGGTGFFAPAAAAALTKKAEGGHIRGPGTETSDSIPARLSDGEFVIRASEVKKPGMLEHLEAINSGQLSAAPGKKESTGQQVGPSVPRKTFAEIVMAQHAAHGDLLSRILKGEK